MRYQAGCGESQILAIMFQFSQIPLEKIDLKKDFPSPQTGALVTFEGLVRNHNDKRKVVALEYEASERLAQKEAQKILAEVQKKFDVLKVKCIHRLGKLTIGEMAVWIGVSAAHRSQAFAACRYVIDEIKSRLPIWKKEYYENDSSGWVHMA